MINPSIIFKMKGLLERFNANHPRVKPFLSTINSKGITPGTVIELKVNFEDGTEYKSNIKVNEEDMEMFNELKQFGNQ